MESNSTFDRAVEQEKCMESGSDFRMDKGQSGKMNSFFVGKEREFASSYSMDPISASIGG